MRIAIHHQLSITPPPETGNMVFQLLMTPRSGATQKVERWSVETTGIGNAARYADAFGNTVHFVNQMRPEGPVGITATGVVETSDRNGVLGKPTGEPVPGLYLRATTLTKVPVTLYGKFRGMKDDRIGLLHALMARVGEVLGGEEMQAGQLQSQDGQSQTQTVGEARKADAALLAHGFIGAARALDIPARYVSGYSLATGSRPGCTAGPRLTIPASAGSASIHTSRSARPSSTCVSVSGSMRFRRRRCGRCLTGMGSRP